MKLLIILLIATVAWQSQVLRYVEDPEARCLDGTRAVIGYLTLDLLS